MGLTEMFQVLLEDPTNQDLLQRDRALLVGRMILH